MSNASAKLTRGSVSSALRAAIAASLDVTHEPAGRALSGTRIGQTVSIEGFDDFELRAVRGPSHVLSKHDSKWFTIRRTSTRRVLVRDGSVSAIDGPVGLAARVVKAGGLAGIEGGQVAADAAILSRFGLVQS
jgi:hypothetical protein